jgi:hypothetical protein
MLEGRRENLRSTNADWCFFFPSELAREKMWSRIHLIPVLQAEEDRDLVRRHWAEQAREKELLGAETKVYNNDRCVMKLSEPRLGSRKRSMDTNIGADSCVPHTQSHPAKPQSRGRQVGAENQIRKARKSCCKYCGLWGVIPRRQLPADDSIKCSFKYRHFGEVHAAGEKDCPTAILTSRET